MDHVAQVVVSPDVGLGEEPPTVDFHRLLFNIRKYVQSIAQLFTSLGITFEMI